MQTRRQSDHEQLEIENLIATEDDPKIRLQLMVMNRINLSLIANTHTINDIAVKLDEHLTSFTAHVSREDALINQGRGMKRVGVILMGLLQGLVVWGLYTVTDAVSAINTAQLSNAVQHAQFDTRIKVLEDR